MKKKISAGLFAVALTIMLVLNGPVSQSYAAPIQIKSSSQTQMQSEPETIYVSTLASLQRRQNFDDNWKFNLGDVSGAWAKEFDDSKWTSISLPHDYSIIQSYQQNLEAESGYLPGGVGWYRKYFTIPNDMQGKRLRIDFDGVYMNATVYVNGQALGSHAYGYTPFSFDITDHIKVGEENVVAVKVDHKLFSSRWYSGSGIYRSVYLTTTDPVHVDLYGQKIDTPSLSSQLNKNVSMVIKTKVLNQSDKNVQVVLTHTIYEKDNDKNVIGEFTTNSNLISSKDSYTFEANFDTSSAPQLWDLKNSKLYVVKTEVKVGSEVVDVIEEDYGFRTFTMDKNTGAYLNGQPIKLKGVCMHHDQGSLGSAAYRRAIERQVEILKKMGANSIRVTHNPAAEVLIDVCNEQGILVINELFDGWKYSKNGNTHDYSEWFDKPIGSNNTILGGRANMKWAEFDVKATLLSGQNDPSIIMWSLGNEIQQDSSDAGYKQVAADLIRWAQETNTSKMLTIGSNEVKNQIGNNNNTHIDIANQLTNVGGSSGANYASGNQYDRLHNAHPNWLLYGSETASAVNSRGVYTTKKNGGAANNPSGLDANKQLTSYDKSKVPWGAFASEAWYEVIMRDFVAGEYVWTGFDYIGEPTPANGVSGGPRGSWPSPKNSYFGIIDTAGFPKDSYYFYQSQWNDEVTTLHILPSWNRNDVVIDGSGKVEVVVYSDAPKVTLYLDPINGGPSKELGTLEMESVKSDTGLYSYLMVKGQPQTHTGLYRTFSVPYEEGTLRAVAMNADGSVINNTDGVSSVKTYSEAKSLSIKADRKEIDADGHDLVYIEVDILDKDNNPVYNAVNRVRFKVEGKGELIGVDNGSSPDHDSYQLDNRRAHAGKVLAIVRATSQSGEFTVTASADGLSSATVKVKTLPVGTSSTTKQIVSYLLSRNFYVKKGNMPELPGTIEATYSDGQKENKPVTWENIDQSQLTSDTPFQVKGEVASLPVSVNVSMIDNVAALLNYSTSVPKGSEKITLPAKRPAVLEDGTILNASFDVTWDSYDKSLFANEGTVVVNGKANVFGEEKKVTASIRVQEETVSFAGNIAPVATLAQDVDKTSDNLEAIHDGVKEYKMVSTGPNPNVWSNYDNSQAGDNQAEISFEYVTQKRIGQIEVTFFRDNWSARFPDPGSVKFYLDGSRTELVAQEIIPSNQVTSGTGTSTYTYKFTPVLATVIYMNITNSSTQSAAQPHIKVCTGITEVEIQEAVGSFSTYSSAELASLTLNGKALSSDQLATGKVETPALVAKLENLVSKENASITVLPEYKEVVRILLESEDGKARETFAIYVNKAVAVTPGDSSRDVPFEDDWTIIAGSQELPGYAKEMVKDDDLDTYWHTQWGTTATLDQRYIGYVFPEAKTLDGLRYYPRSGGNGDNNGRVRKYKIEYRENDGDEWKSVDIKDASGTPVQEAEWPLDTTDWLAADFADPVQAKEIRLVGVETVGDGGQDNKFMSCIELRVTAPVQKIDLSRFTASFDPDEVKDGVVSLVLLKPGQEVRPAVIVVDDKGDRLDWGIHYKVTYSDNTSFNDNAVAAVEGIIDYSGKIELPFKIRQQAKSATALYENGTYNKIYEEGDFFNPTGLNFKVLYDDLSEEALVYDTATAALFTFSPSLTTQLTAGDSKITITYNGVSLGLPITVNSKQGPTPGAGSTPDAGSTPGADLEPAPGSTTAVPSAPQPPSDSPGKPSRSSESPTREPAVSGKVDIKALEKILEDVDGLSSEDYEPEGWENLQELVKAAQPLRKDDKISQEEVDGMVERLTQTFNALVLKEKEPDAETEGIDSPTPREEENAQGSTAESPAKSAGSFSGLRWLFIGTAVLAGLGILTFFILKTKKDG